MTRRLPLIAIVGTAIVLVMAWFIRSPDEIAREGPAPQQTQSAERLRNEVPAHRVPHADQPKPPAVDGTSEESAGTEGAASGDEDSEPMDDAMAEAWAQVDLDAVRRAMPDNLYFKLSVPTKDEAVLAERAAERARWNDEYGKILSGTGTEEEIRAYYDQQARLSGDYVEFTTYLLDHYRDTLVGRDVGLLELARRLHLARLEEIPRKVEEANERKRQQDKARAEWLADEAAFGRNQ